MKKNLIRLVLISIILLVACDGKKKQKIIKIHGYKYKNACKTSEDNDGWLFYYFILSSNGGCYYTASYTQTSSFSSSSFYYSPTVPIVQNGSQIEEGIDENELPSNMQQEIEENVEPSEVSGAIEMSNETQTGETADPGEGESDGSSEPPSSNDGGSDGGSGDGGGGD